MKGTHYKYRQPLWCFVEVVVWWQMFLCCLTSVLIFFFGCVDFWREWWSRVDIFLFFSKNDTHSYNWGQICILCKSIESVAFYFFVTSMSLVKSPPWCSTLFHRNSCRHLTVICLSVRIVSDIFPFGDLMDGCNNVYALTVYICSYVTTVKIISCFLKLTMTHWVWFSVNMVNINLPC